MLLCRTRGHPGVLRRSNHSSAANASSTEVVQWTNKIAVHSRSGQPKLALTMFRQMQLHGVGPDSVTWITVLKACANTGSIVATKLVHTCLLECSLRAPIANALVNAYGKCGSVQDAQKVFNSMARRDVVSWNTLITAFAHNGQSFQALKAFEEMRETGTETPDSVTFIAVLNACCEPGFLAAGRRIHSLAVEQKLVQADVVLANAVINMYNKCGSLRDADDVFNAIQGFRDVVSWNAIISAHAQHNDSRVALQLFKQMQHQGFLPDKITFVTTLNAFSDGCWSLLNNLQSQIIESGFEMDVVVGNALMNAYGKSGSLDDARRLFDGLEQRDVVSWNAMITAYVQHGRCVEALHLYQKMEAVVPNKITFVTTLGACDVPEALEQGKLIHARIVDFGFESDLIVGNALVTMYSKCGSSGDARAVFDRMAHRDVVSWNAMSAAYVHNGLGHEALQLFRQMLLESFVPERITFATVLGACTVLQDGKLVHSVIRERGLEADAIVANSLVVMYSKCHSVYDAELVFEGLDIPATVVCNSLLETYYQHGMFEEAESLFEDMEKRDVGTWNAVLGACRDTEEAFRLFKKMQLEGVPANRGTYLALLESVTEAEAARAVQVLVAESGYDLDRALGGALVKTYGKCEMLQEAKRVFDELPHKDVVTWTTMIGAYVQDDKPQEALEAFEQMELARVVPDSLTIVTVLGGLKGAEMLDQGRQIHSRVLESGWNSNPMVGNALLTMYGKCGALDEALEVFQQMPQRNVVSWNALIAAYVNQGCSAGAFQVFQRMQMEGVEPNNVTFITILNAAALENDKGARPLELQDIENRAHSDVATGNALLNMYGRYGSIDEAKRLFVKMASQRDVISWNAMISATVQTGNLQEAAYVFRHMQLQGMGPNNVTFINMLNGCTGPQLLGQGKHLHDMIVQAGLETSDVAVANAVIHMYGKCRDVGNADDLFQRMPKKDLITWNGMIAAYSQMGRCREARKLFDEMEDRDVVTWNTIIAAHTHNEDQADEAVMIFHQMLQQGVAPNSVTLVVVLSACASSSWLAEGRTVHRLMMEMQMPADGHIGNALVYMYGRCGRFDRAWEVFDDMTGKDAVSWNCLIAAYAHNGHAVDALRLFLVMQREGSKPTELTFVSIFTACSHAGQIEEARQYFGSLAHDYGLVPIPSHYGCMVDLLGRAGRLDEADELIRRIPREQVAGGLPWMTLLSACRVQEDVDLGKAAAEQVLRWDPRSSAASVVLSNIYASRALKSEDLWSMVEESKLQQK